MEMSLRAPGPALWRSVEIEPGMFGVTPIKESNYPLLEREGGVLGAYADFAPSRRLHDQATFFVNCADPEKAEQEAFELAQKLNQREAEGKSPRSTLRYARKFGQPGGLLRLRAQRKPRSNPMWPFTQRNPQTSVVEVFAHPKNHVVFHERAPAGEEGDAIKRGMAEAAMSAWETGKPAIFTTQTEGVPASSTRIKVTAEELPQAVVPPEGAKSKRLDPEIWDAVKSAAKNKYGARWKMNRGKMAWALREYKRRGGRYSKGPKPQYPRFRTNPDRSVVTAHSEDGEEVFRAEVPEQYQAEAFRAAMCEAVMKAWDWESSATVVVEAAGFEPTVVTVSADAEPEGTEPPSKA
jgi:hypothetical protein